MRTRHFVTASVLVLLFAGTTGLLGAATGESPCAVADSLLEAGQLDPAAEALVTLLEDDLSLACARRSLEAVADRRAVAQAKYELGQRYENVGDPKAAIKAYVEAIGTDQSLKVANTALLSLGAGDDVKLPPCAVAESLLKARQLDPAKKALNALLEEDASCKCAREGLEDVLEKRAAAQAKYKLGKRYEKLGDLKAATDAYLEAMRADQSLEDATEALLSLGEVPDAVKLARFGLKDEALEALKTEVTEGQGLRLEGLQATIGDQRLAWWRGFLLVGGPWVKTIGEILLLGVFLGLTIFRPLWRRLLTPSLKLEPFKGSAPEGDIGAELSVLVADQLKRFGSKGDASLDVVEGGEISAQPLPDEVGAGLPGETAWLAAFPALLKWLRPAKAIVVTGALHSESDHGPGATLLVASNKHLVATETFWLKDLEPDVATETFALKDLEPGMAAESETADYYRLSDWMACWLLFCVPRKGFGQKSKKPTRIVGTTDWKSYAWFRKGLLAVAGKKVEDAKRFFRAAINQDSSNAGAKVNLGGLLAISEEVADKIKAKELFLTAKRQGSADGRDPVYYAASYSLAAVTFDLAQTNADEKAKAEALVEADALVALIKKSKAWIRSSSDLGRYCQKIEPGAQALAAGLHLVAGTDKERVDNAKAYLEAHLANADALVLKKQSTRTRYNIACALSVWGGLKGEHDEDKKQRIGELAFELLQLSLRGSWTALKRFPSDGTLEFVKERHRVIIQEILDELEEDPPSTEDADLPLQRIASIGRHAATLDSMGIQTANSLLVRLLTDQSRKGLAGELGLTLPTIEGWFQLLELLRLKGMSLDYLVLFDIIGPDTLADPRFENDAKKLADLLGDAAKAREVTSSPEEGQVAVWLLQAKEPIGGP